MPCAVQQCLPEFIPSRDSVLNSHRLLETHWHLLSCLSASCTLCVHVSMLCPCIPACVRACVHMTVGHMYHSVCTEDKLWELILPLWDPGIELRTSWLHGKCFFSLSCHLFGPPNSLLLNTFFDINLFIYLEIRPLCIV